MDGPWQEVIYNLSLSCVSVGRPTNKNWTMPMADSDKDETLKEMFHIFSTSESSLVSVLVNF